MSPRLVIAICACASIAVTLAWSALMHYTKCRDARDLAARDDALLSRAGRP